MFVRIAVLDPLPLFRHGVIAALREAGLGGEAPEDVFRWIGDEHRRLVVLTLQSADDWMVLMRLRRSYDDVPVVAMLAESGVPNQVRALTSGAVAALPRDSQPATLRAIVAGVLNGTTEIPVEVLRRITAAPAPNPSDPSVPTAQELEWLSLLVAGRTVAEIADHAGYSERMMFRLFRELYKRMNVSGRTEALLLARRRGWV